MPQRNAEPLQLAPYEGDGFHAAPAGSLGTFAFVREWRIAESVPETTRLPAPLRRPQLAPFALSTQAVIPVPAMLLSLGSLAWVLRAGLRSS